ncbi:MAG: leucine-rich repeat domain-containing protein [Muribaculaceae bacterium]|nr:leucine-rich repeat domain-containing protein [Muribaculaceae bacterium]
MRLNIFKLTAAAAASMALLELAPAAQAVTIDVAPGKLAGALESAVLDSELRISGVADARDLNILRELPADVTSLDLSNTVITALTADSPVHLGKTMFEANHLPAYILFRAPFSSVVLPEGLTVIENGALAGSAVTEITIPEGVTFIGEYAFYGCRNLKTVNLPSTLLSIGRGAFAGCPVLENINLDATRVTLLPEECFSGDVSLRSLDAIHITTVGTRALAGSGIERLSLPAAEDLGDFALADMPDLLVLTVSPSARFGVGALMNCSSLVSVNGTPDIVPDLFAANCTSLQPTSLISNAESIGKFSLANSSVDQIVLGPGLTSLDENALKGATALTYIDATALTSDVPDAFDSTFAGLDPATIKLKVSDDNINDWKAHAVWSKFDIFSEGTLGVDDIPTSSQYEGIAISFNGNTLTATAPEPITSAAIYDLNGNLLLTLPAGECVSSADTSSLPAGVWVVAVRTASAFKGIKVIN